MMERVMKLREILSEATVGSPALTMALKEMEELVEGDGAAEVMKELIPPLMEIYFDLGREDRERARRIIIRYLQGLKERWQVYSLIASMDYLFRRWLEMKEVPPDRAVGLQGELRQIKELVLGKAGE